MWDGYSDSFDLATITSLQPTGETFYLTLKHQINPNFTFNHPSFKNYIEDHHDTTKEVYDYEDIDFLTLGLSHFIFWSSSLEVAKNCIPLATQLHEKVMYVLVN